MSLIKGVHRSINTPSRLTATKASLYRAGSAEIFLDDTDFWIHTDHGDEPFVHMQLRLGLIAPALG